MAVTVSRSSNVVTVKGKGSSLVLGPSLVVNGYTIPGPGEYDVAGVGVVVHAASNTLVLHAVVDGVGVLYCDGHTLKPDQVGDIPNTALVVVNARGENPDEFISKLVRFVDPTNLIVIEEGAELAAKLPYATATLPAKVSEGSADGAPTTLLV
jgi:hypothetical protein